MDKLSSGMPGDLDSLRSGRSEFVARFVGAMIDSQKAWTHTPMLARVSADKARQLDELFCSFDPTQIREYFQEMANGTWTQQVMVHGFDAAKLEKLSAIVMRQLVLNACVRGAASPDVSAPARLRMLLDVAFDWIEGIKMEGDLLKIHALLGDHPEIRLMLVAPFAPGLAISGVILRALGAKYPFAGSINQLGG